MSQQNWKVSRLSRCQRTGGYCVSGTYLVGSKEVKIGQVFVWSMRWADGFAKSLYQYDFSEVVWTAEAHEWATKQGHEFPGLATALIVH